MTIKESLNRAFNLLGTSVVGLAGFAFMPEIFLENDRSDKIDDILLFLIAIAGIIWYLTGGHKYKRSVAPVVLVCLSFLAKILAVVIEFRDAEALGDDMGGMILFLLATGLVVFQYFKTKRLLASAEQA